LEQLHTQYPEDLVILAFPCNQFGAQEPDSLESILENTAKTYGRTFPLMDKVDVTGEGAIPLYKWLNANGDITYVFDIPFYSILTKQTNTSQTQSQKHSWNFHKFLIGRDGELHGSYKSKLSPASMKSDIVALLDRSKSKV
jgi:glutathione peroxidase-family protein